MPRYGPIPAVDASELGTVRRSMAVLLPPRLPLPQDWTLCSPKAMYSPGTGQKLHLVAVPVGFMVHVCSMTSLEHIPSMTVQCISSVAVHPGVPSSGTRSGTILQ